MTRRPVAKPITAAKPAKPKPRKPAAPKVEKIPAAEPRMIEEIAKLTAVLQDRRKASQDGEMLRGVHPKSHGCVNATFTVKDPLRMRLRVGLFREPGKTFKAKIRYSNATTSITPDVSPGEDGGIVNTSRGFALKVMGVKGKLIMKDGRRNAQDFLMINTPGFAFGNVRDYLRATHALMADPAGVNGELFFLPLKLMQLGLMGPDGKLVPASDAEPPELAQLRHVFQNSIFAGFTAKDLAATLKSFAVVQQIQAAAVRNPLETPYFTAAPFRFGSRRIARFRVMPLAEPDVTGPIKKSEAKKLGPDFLAKALAASLSAAKKGKKTIKLSFQAQVMHPVELEGQIDEMIEDATATWDEDEFPFVEMATIEIDPKDQPKDLVDACKGERFTPWHSLQAHEPLGGINRLRKPVYVTSGDTRLGRKPKPEEPPRPRRVQLTADDLRVAHVDLRAPKIVQLAPQLRPIRGLIK